MSHFVRATFLFLLVTLLALDGGCAFAPKSKFRPKEDETKGDKKKVEQVEDFDPLSLDDDDLLLQQAKESTPIREGEREEVRGIVPGTKEVKESEQVQGYRVQIFVSSSLESAQKIMAEAEEYFPTEAYLQYDAPYYKVRVGNCLTRREGDLLKEKAVRSGYRDAWVVRSLVVPPEK